MSAEHIYSQKQNMKTKDNILFSWPHLVWSILSILVSVHSCSSTALAAVEQEFSLPLGSA